MKVARLKTSVYYYFLLAFGVIVVGALILFFREYSIGLVTGIVSFFVVIFSIDFKKKTSTKVDRLKPVALVILGVAALIVGSIDAAIKLSESIEELTLSQRVQTAAMKSIYEDFIQLNRPFYLLQIEFSKGNTKLSEWHFSDTYRTNVDYLTKLYSFNFDDLSKKPVEIAKVHPFRYSGIYARELETDFKTWRQVFVDYTWPALKELNEISRTKSIQKDIPKTHLEIVDRLLACALVGQLQQIQSSYVNEDNQKVPCFREADYLEYLLIQEDMEKAGLYYDSILDHSPNDS